MGQKSLSIEFKPGQQVEEYTPEKSGIHRELPEGYSKRILEESKNRSGMATFSTQGSKSSTQVVVSYETPPPANVKAVFEKAAGVWANTLSSDVPIQIFVRWRPLATGVLGSAGASTVVRNFAGANRLNTWYPIALAEKMSHQNLNGKDPDVVATFNSDFSDWSPEYFSAKKSPDHDSARPPPSLRSGPTPSSPASAGMTECWDANSGFQSASSASSLR
jgi:hypothetical protein